MKIKKETEYRIKGKSKYFKGKYGTTNPVIRIEDLWIKITGGSWMWANGNPACMYYGMRSGMERLPTDDRVYYGKIGGLGELVHESELEEIKKTKGRA